MVGIWLGAALISDSLARLLRNVGGGSGGGRDVGIWVVSQASRELCRAERLVGIWSNTASVCLFLTFSAFTNDGGVGQGRSQDDARSDAITHNDLLERFGKVFVGVGESRIIRGQVKNLVVEMESLSYSKLDFILPIWIFTVFQYLSDVCHVGGLRPITSTSCNSTKNSYM